MTEDFDGLGLAFWSIIPTEEIVEYAKLGEKYNFKSIWIAEYYHYRSAIPIATAISTATRRITVGLGILPTHTRHPGLIAMETATLDEILGKRVILGLGAAKTAASRHQSKVSALSALSESIHIIRELLSGKNLTFTGKIFTIEDTSMGFSPPRHDVPIYVGTYPYSKRTLRLAGEMANGVVLVWCTPEWVKKAANEISEGARKAGRNPSDIDITAYLVVSVDNDQDRARSACKELLASYTPRVHRYWLHYGMVDDSDVGPVLSAFRLGGLKAAAQEVSDALVDKLAIAGSPEYCLRKLIEYDGTGLRLPILYQVLGPDKARAISDIGKTILPKLTRKIT